MTTPQPAPIPPPTPEDLARDLAADLAVCETAAPGPWELMVCGGHNPNGEIRCIAHPRPDLADKFPPGQYGAVFREDHIVSAWGVKMVDLTFIAIARTALPALIRRCHAAEAKLAFLNEKGITVGLMRSSDQPNEYLAYSIRPGSELCDLRTLEKLTAAEQRVRELESQLASVQAHAESAAKRLMPEADTQTHMHSACWEYRCDCHEQLRELLRVLAQELT